MIQRIQSIFLFLTAGAFFSLFGLPFATSSQATAELLSDGIYDVTDNPVLMALTAVGGGLALMNIFFFNNRSLQIRLGYLIIICALLVGLVAGFLFYQESGSMATNVEPEDGLGIWPVPLAFIFAILSNYFIRKDEKLVRSADRLR